MPSNDSIFPLRPYTYRRPADEQAFLPNAPGARLCPRCRVWRSEEGFGNNRTCQGCRDASRGYHLENIEERRLKDRLRYYNLTLEQYRELQKVQKDECAICGNPERKQHGGETYAISIDHNHETGRVRGLLCADCNLLVSRIERIDMGLLMRVVDYIKADKAAEAK